MATISARVLSLAGPEKIPGWRMNLFWFRLFVLMHMAGRSYLTLRVEEIEGFWYPTVFRCLIVVGATAVIVEAAFWLLNKLGYRGFVVAGVSLWATRAAAVLVVAQIALTMPFTANHVFLELLCLALLAFLDESKADEDELLLQAMRWLTAVFFFYAGLQKVLYGRYFDGQFLAFMAATQDRFADFFRYFMSDEAFVQLRAHELPKLGAGPYRVDSLLFLAISNSVYIFEMVAGILLLVRKARPFTALAIIAFVIVIEIAAREIVFGALMVNLALLFIPGRWNQWLFGLFVGFYLFLIVTNRFHLDLFFYSI